MPIYVDELNQEKHLRMGKKLEFVESVCRVASKLLFIPLPNDGSWKPEMGSGSNSKLQDQIQDAD